MGLVMTCRELVDFLMDYLNGELPAEQQRSFDEHLAECQDCVEYVRTYQETIRLGRQVCADDHTCHADVPEDLVRAILNARTRSNR
jgi:anti-sigma factor RsiW